MRNIFLAPRSNETAYTNYMSSMQGKTLNELEPYLSHEDIKQLEGDERYFVWGCQPSMESRWQQMRKGDYILFYSRGKFISFGELKFKKKSEKLALGLWPKSDESGKAWSCVFFVENVQEINLPIQTFSQLTGYNMDRVQGFMQVTRGLDGIIKEYGSTDNFMLSLSSGWNVGDIEDLVLTANQPSSGLSMEDKGRIDELTREKTEEEINEALRRHALASRSKTPEQIVRMIKTVKRNRKLVADIKAKYKNECQICGFTFQTRTGVLYSEAAHIIPISKRQEGLDSPDNIWVLCANHHKMLDLGALKVVSNTQYLENGVVKNLRAS